MEQVTITQKNSTVDIIKMKKAIRLHFSGLKSDNVLMIGSMTLNQIENASPTINENIDSMTTVKYGTKRKINFSECSFPSKKQSQFNLQTAGVEPSRSSSDLSETHLVIASENQSDCEKMINEL